jgi:hypothetical protein
MTMPRRLVVNFDASCDASRLSLSYSVFDSRSLERKARVFFLGGLGKFRNFRFFFPNNDKKKK